jgi:hypothetical protein
LGQKPFFINGAARLRGIINHSYLAILRVRIQRPRTSLPATAQNNAANWA